MSRLSNLYNAMETLRKEGLTIDDKLEEQVSKLEEDIIKNDILPIVKESIEPALKDVQRELVLVVDYNPNQPISVHLSRRSNVAAELDAKEIRLDDVAEHGSREMANPPKTHAPASGLEICFPDGVVIAEKKATDTMVAAVKKIGVARVRQVVIEENLVFCKVPVISNRRDSKYGRAQKDLGDGWLLMTHSNNQMKKTFFEKLSNALNLELKVKIE